CQRECWPQQGRQASDKKRAPRWVPSDETCAWGGDGAGHSLNPPDPNQFHSHLKKNRPVPENLKEPFPGPTEATDAWETLALLSGSYQLISAGGPVRSPDPGILRV